MHGNAEREAREQRNSETAVLTPAVRGSIGRKFKLGGRFRKLRLAVYGG